MKSLTLTLFLLWTQIAAGEDAKNVAIVQVAKGSVLIQSAAGGELKAAKGLWVKEGSVVKTSARSFVRLRFIDKSLMNVGPNSQMKIESFSKDEAGVISVLSGKIRSQVSKDYLEMDKEKSKMFLKSKSAVMGIRGTDFIFSANGKTGATTAILFEGSVVFNKISPESDLNDLESVVNRGRRIHPGQFSVSRPDMARATVPAKLSSAQFRVLKKNETFIASAPEASKRQRKRSVVPPGLTGRAVSSKSEGLRESLEKKFNIRSERKRPKEASESKGFERGQDLKPVDGSIVHIDTGTIIPLGVDSQFDENHQEWVSNSFEVDNKSGEILPPEGYILTKEGKLLKEEGEGNFKEVILEVKPLDQVKTLNEMPTASLEGPAPAAVPNEPKNHLDRPPILDGDTLHRENLPIKRPILPTTPVKFRVIKGNE